MDSETARMIVIAIAAVLAVVWLIAVQCMIAATRERGARAQQAAERFGIEEPTVAAGTFTGEAEVDGFPEDLSKKLAAALARDGMGPMAPVKIVSCDTQEVGFESMQQVSTSSPIRRGKFRLSRSGSRTRIEYALDGSSGQVLLMLGWVFIALGFLAIVGVIWMQFQFVLPSLNPQVHWQSIQTFQAVHFVWPPFLFAFLSRQVARNVRARVDSLINNLPYA